MDNNFQKYLYLIGLLAIIIALITIFSVLSEINNFFTEKIKISMSKYKIRCIKTFYGIIFGSPNRTLRH